MFKQKLANMGMSTLSILLALIVLPACIGTFHEVEMPEN